MKVDVLFILQINGGGDTIEIDDSVDAIIMKSQKNRTERLIVVESPATPSASAWKGLFEKDDYLVSCKQSTKNADVEKAGLYIVSHGSTNAIGGVHAEHIASLVDELGIKNLKKLCVFACNTANDLANSTAASRSFLGEIAMHIKTSTPMIAGYSGYITGTHSEMKDAAIGVVNQPITSSHPKNAELKRVKELRDTIRNKGSTLYKNSSTRGRTFPLSNLSIEEKAKIKFVVQKVGEKVESVPLADWHNQ